MTFGKMNQTKNNLKKIFLLLICLSVTPAAYAVSANNLKLNELFQMFSQQKQSTVDFSEEKYASFLEEPIISSGHFEFSAPDKLYKFITKPDKISQKVEGNILEINEANEVHSIDLNEHPEFSAILRSIINLLSGNLAALKKDFKLEYKNTSSGWTLLLTPRDSYVSGYIDSIKMFGETNKLLKIVVTEPNNDHSVTYISNHR